ncbi:hypothetical protein FQZ97_1159110 [compost metagenome]
MVGLVTARAGELLGSDTELAGGLDQGLLVVPGQGVGAGLGQFPTQGALDGLVVGGFLLNVDSQGADLAVAGVELLQGVLQICPAQVE